MWSAGPAALWIAGPGGILVTQDAGTTWRRIEWPGGQVHRARDGFAVADEGKQSVWLCRVHDDRLERLCAFPPAIHAEEMAVAGQTVRIAAVCLEEGFLHLEHALLTSTDGGKTFRRSRLPVTSTAAVGLRGERRTKDQDAITARIVGKTVSRTSSPPGRTRTLWRASVPDSSSRRFRSGFMS